MEIAVCGVNHHLAPVAILEKLAFSQETRRQALAQLTMTKATSDQPAAEAVILSTCNRVELYVAGSTCPPGEAGLVQFLADFHDLAPEELAPYVYTYRGEEAVRHLLRVAAGLDSLVIGEPQILGQVRTAYAEARESGATGPILSALFRRAIQAGKRVHTETAISQGAASVSYAAVEVAASLMGDLGDRHLVIIGAGKTGQLAAQCLLGRGAQKMTVINRSYDAAAQLAKTWGGAAGTLADVEPVLLQADVVISATRAPGYVLTADQVRRAQAARGGRPLLLIDIAVPRDIDPAAAEIPGVTVRNIDDLHAVVAANLDQRRSDSRRAETIIDAEIAEFMAWFGALAVAPVITDLREQADMIRRRELERARHRLSPNDLDLVDMLTQRIVNQLLHQPTVRLKEHACQSDGALYAEALRDLFALGGAQDEE
ncbi:MAG TPA: glutamyl-tRNA reductase [Anaerolineae bacterium]